MLALAKKVIRLPLDAVQAVYSLWAVAQSLGWLVVLSPLGIVPLGLENPSVDRFSYRVVRLWGLLSSWCAGMWYRVEGKEYRRNHPACIVVANHRSYLDAWVLTAVLSRPFKVLGKVEILKMPLVGFAFRYVGVAVDRSSRKSGVESLSQLREALKAQKDIFVFPEGTFTQPGERLSRFRKGAFAVAIDTQTPILPMVIEDSSRHLPDHSWRFLPGRIRVRFLPPVSTEGLTRTDLPDLRERVFRAMQKQLSTPTRSG